jgi:7-keto-8-aminopelargonate synthetase-like enzyme
MLIPASYIPAAALNGSLREYRMPGGRDLEKRTEPFFAWQDLRRQHGVWPYCRSTEIGPQPHCPIIDDAGRRNVGINFASQDYLSLSGHPAIKAAAIEAIERYGVHSAGSPAFVGNTGYSLALERKIAEFLKMEHTVLFPTGFAAGMGVIKGLVRSSDYIVMDAMAHACLHDGAEAATKNVYLHRHLDIDSARRWLKHIRAKDTENGILVVTESLFSMESDTPDIRQMQELCREFGATLMVDMAHDLGNLGEDGRGHLGLQKMVGEVDIVMGSFSKTFGSNGGFVATKSRAVKEYLRYFSTPGTFSNGLSPVQAAVVLKAFEIVDSAEGTELRGALNRNVVHLRDRLRQCGMEVYGDPSAIVCVKMGTETLARLVSRQLPELGLVANLVEFPAVPKGKARFRLQVMAKHRDEHILGAVEVLREALAQASADLDLVQQPAALGRATA